MTETARFRRTARETLTILRQHLGKELVISTALLVLGFVLGWRYFLLLPFLALMYALWVFARQGSTVRERERQERQREHMAYLKQSAEIRRKYGSNIRR